MGNWEDTAKESKKRWETNADFWDERMGEHSNQFHREIIRPDTEKLLNIKHGDKVLDMQVTYKFNWQDRSCVLW